MTFDEFPPAARDVVLRPLREAITKRRHQLAGIDPNWRDTRDSLAADIAVMEAAIAKLEAIA